MIKLKNVRGTRAVLLIAILSRVTPLYTMERDQAEFGNQAAELVQYDQIAKLPADLILYIIGLLEGKDQIFVTKQLLIEVKKGRQKYLETRVNQLKALYKNSTRKLAERINTIFCQCVGPGKEKEAVELIEMGADVNCSFPTQSRALRSAFEIAMDHKNIQMITAATKNGAWLDCPMNSYGSVPLAHACALFIKERCFYELDLKDQGILLAWQRSVLVIEALIKAGASVEVPVTVYEKTKPVREWLSVYDEFKLLLEKVETRL